MDIHGVSIVLLGSESCIGKFIINIKTDLDLENKPLIHKTLRKLTEVPKYRKKLWLQNYQNLKQ
jgi:hypothetical protein